MGDRILVLAVDIDNDLYRKTRISGPVVGRANNLSAATRLALADPLDTDSNTMFEAVRKYDELKKLGHTVNVATLTGAENEGFAADSELSRQIEMVMGRFKADYCVLVTDGSSDLRVLPLLKTRLTVNSVDIVRMKQAEGVENTYYTIIEKLKEPHYARIVFGIPAVLLIMFALSYYLNFGWQLPVALIGLYLILKGFGLEEGIVNSLTNLGVSRYRMSFVFYMASIIFFLIALIVGFGSYSSAVAAKVADPLTLTAYAIQGFLLVLPLSLLLYLVGRVADFESQRKRYRAIAYGTYIGFAIGAAILLYAASVWITGGVYFWQFLLVSALVLLGGYVVAEASLLLRSRALRRAGLKNKQVINDIGAYIGIVEDVDVRKGMMLIKTDYGSTIKYDTDRITNIADQIIVR